MSDSKSYLTVNELQQINRKFGLSEEGTKQELIKRIVDFSGNVDSNDSKNSLQPLNFSRIQLSRTQITNHGFSTEKSVDRDQSLDPNASTWNFRNNSLFVKIVFVLLCLLFVMGCFGGLISLYNQFGSVEMVEIPVKRSWFDSYT